jgi:charged multivesicular body protein 2A
MASMNRGMNLPAIQKIMNEFERESSMMDMKEEMMSDTVDDVMDAEEDEEEEGDKILREVLDEIGVGLAQQVTVLQPYALYSYSQYLQLTDAPTGLAVPNPAATNRQLVAVGEDGGSSSRHENASSGQESSGMSDEDALQARLDALRRGL